jgi:positive regulator of sigma E activity
MQLDNTIDAECGQAVMVGLPESLFLRLVLRFYLLPLLAGLVGGVIGHYLAFRMGAGLIVSDLLTLAFAVLGASLTLWKNRASPSEFSELSAVHLLRAVGEQETKEEVRL